MRTLPTDLLEHLSKTSLTPVWLVELILADGTAFRRCSHGDIDLLLGYAWAQSNLVVKGPEVRSGASMTATLQITEDSGILSSFMADDWSFCQARLHFTYYCGLDLSAPVLLLDGEVDSVERANQTVSISLVSTGNKGSITPWIRIARPTFTWLTPRGTVLTWGADKIVIDRS